MTDTNQNLSNMENLVRGMIENLGEDSTREGLLKTPHRVAKAMSFLTKGYNEDPKAIINEAIFHEDTDEMIVVKDIEIYSLCEHHMLPFVGKAHIAYIPNGKIIGLSKVSRVVEVFARRLQVQERLTKQIAETLQECLNPCGVAVVIQAAHLCMQMRGVQKQSSSMITSCMFGDFKEELAARTEFLNFIQTSL